MEIQLKMLFWLREWMINLLNAWDCEEAYSGDVYINRTFMLNGFEVSAITVLKQSIVYIYTYKLKYIYIYMA